MALSIIMNVLINNWCVGEKKETYIVLIEEVNIVGCDKLV